MICETCKHQPKRCSYAVDYGEMIGCSFYTPRIATKADQFRNMTDEELAKFIRELDTRGLQGLYCAALLDGADCISGVNTCTDCILKWLQQPAETEGKK